MTTNTAAHLTAGDLADRLRDMANSSLITPESRNILSEAATRLRVSLTPDALGDALGALDIYKPGLSYQESASLILTELGTVTP